MADHTNEIKEALKSGRTIIGTDRTLKYLKLGKLEKVFISSNAPSSVKDEVKELGTDVEIIDAGIKNDELGTVCKKQFSISIIGLIKE